MKNILLVLFATILASCSRPGSFSETPATDTITPKFLFILSAQSGSYADNTLSLNGVPHVIYFSDSPKRIVGHMSLKAFVENWSKNSRRLANNLPNAAFSTVENTTDSSVVEITGITDHHEDTLRLRVKTLEGKLPESFGESATVVDSITSNIKTPGVY